MSQSQKIRKSKTFTVAIVDNKAYWVHNNIFYEANVIDGYVDKDAAQPIDAYKLSPKKFRELLDILDSII